MTKTRESAMLEMQHAIIDTINNNAHLTTTHDVLAYDYVPESVAADNSPFIAVGDPMESDWDCLGEEYGQRVVTRLHVWSTYRGRKEASDIVKHLKQLFANQAMTITGYSHVKTTTPFSTVMLDPDKVHSHGVVDLNVYVVQN